ncbi:MAG: GHMP kinase [Chloroflexi bacterium]|nr:GHMP kinase [Chloroflexota bacterium]
MIIARGPVRISLAGGGTDMPAYYEKHGGAVISATINKHFYAFYEPRDDSAIQIISSDFRTVLSVDDFYSLKFGEGFDIPSAVIKHYRIYQGSDLFMASEVPPGSGLGSSGAVTVTMVCLCAHIKNEKMTRRQIAEDAYFVQKEILNLPIGKQDEYASAYGGLNLIEFRKEGVSVHPLKIAEDTRKRLEKNCLLFFTGRTREASAILRQQDESARRDDSQVVEAMNRLKEAAYLVKAVLEEGDLDRFGELLRESWEQKKRMSKDISNETLDSLYELARANGALGGKLTGAGGGGFFLFYCQEENHQRLKDALAVHGVKPLDFKFESKGVTILNQS